MKETNVDRHPRAMKEWNGGIRSFLLSTVLFQFSAYFTCLIKHNREPVTTAPLLYLHNPALISTSYCDTEVIMKHMYNLCTDLKSM